MTDTTAAQAAFPEIADHAVVAREEWLAARAELLAAEKALTHQREAVAAQRRAMPWVEIPADYSFESETGPVTLLDLFDGRPQLIVQHFMYGPDWTEGCPSCSFWADSFNGAVEHLAARDTAFVLVSRAPLDSLLAYRTRMGWTLPWVSSLGSDFNIDFGVSFPAPVPEGATYNYLPVGPNPMEESPGISTFATDGERVFHTYSTFARGLDTYNSIYQLLDATPLGRHEGDLPWSMAWLRRRDEY